MEIKIFIHMSNLKNLEKYNEIQSQMFVPSIFLILTSIWGILYFGFINFYVCSPQQTNISCFVMPILSWATWLISSAFFIFLCLLKVINDKKSIDILILIGYSWLYFITLKILFN